MTTFQWKTYNVYGDAVPIADLPWDAVTHILHVYWGVYGNGQLGPDLLVPCSAQATSLISEAHARGVKVLLCVGALDLPGVPCGTNLYNNAASNAWTAASNIVSTVNYYGYDGVALDWEPPIAMTTTFPVLTSLLRALRLQMPNPKLLTCAAFARIDSAQLWGRSEAMSYLDRLHLMAFDLVGRSAGRSFFNAALYGGSFVDEANAEMSVESNVDLFLSYGVPPDRLNVVLPFYGYKLFSSPSPFATATATPGAPPDTQLDYNAIVNSYLPGATYNGWDPVSLVPWALKQADGWVSYDDPTSIRAKVDFVRRKRLGGIDAHHIGATRFPTASVKYPLWKAVVDGFAAADATSDPSVKVEIDTGSLVRWTGGTHPQTFSGRIFGTAIPSTIDVYVFSMSEVLERYMSAVSTAGGVWSATPSSPVGVGTYWVYVFAPGNQILAKRKFTVRDSV